MAHRSHQWEMEAAEMMAADITRRCSCPACGDNSTSRQPGQLQRSTSTSSAPDTAPGAHRLANGPVAAAGASMAAAPAGCAEVGAQHGSACHQPGALPAATQQAASSRVVNTGSNNKAHHQHSSCCTNKLQL